MKFYENRQNWTMLFEAIVPGYCREYRSNKSSAGTIEIVRVNMESLVSIPNKK